MPWTPGANGGFTTGTPWLPVDRHHLELSVQNQEDNPDSTLNSIRRLIRWRQNQPALVRGDLELIENTGDALCWVRRAEEQSMLVALNVTSRELRIPVPCGIDRLASDHGFTGFIDGGDLVLPPYQALFAEL